MIFNLKDFNIKKFDSILARGLSSGLGSSTGSMCIEAAICSTLGLPHGDDPGCVSNPVRTFKIKLNDSNWSSPQARAKGLRDLGIAQLGSKGVVLDTEFSNRIAEKTIRVLIPKLFRQLAKGRKDWLEAADRCEKEGTKEAVLKAKTVATASYAADATDAAAYAATAASYAANNATTSYAAADTYLNLSASLALEVLRELQSPGVELLDS